MRLLLQLKAAKDQIYENSYNRNIQAFIYDLVKDTQYTHDLYPLINAIAKLKARTKREDSFSILF